MNISLNNKTIQIESGITLQGLIDMQLGEKQKGVAAAIDGAVIPKQEWKSTSVKDNQSILIIKATQGG
jgi:sulfur carrier protein